MNSSLISHLYSNYDKHSSAPERFKAADCYSKWLIEKYFPKNKNASILDLGCGWGKLLLAAKHLGYTNLHGIDGSQSQVDEAKRLGLSNIHCCNIESLIAKNKSQFNLIVLMDVIEHLDDASLEALLKSLPKLLKRPGGLLIQTNNGCSPFFGSIRYGDATHIRAFTPSSIVQLFRAYGMDDTSVHEITPKSSSALKQIFRHFVFSFLMLPLRALCLAETGSWPKVLSRNLIATVGLRNESN